ncbi:MAG: hypothetical protein UR32_C0009G0019 [candidate division WS6 bacterium GW2011_GWE2_33_157]|nr:MAG: hypothetical protein UR32_C0009G0019 [candidate division WS6 bacterium GW2011_GWE2_33_157]
MKKFNILLILLGILLFTSPTFAQEDNERILEYTSDIVVNSDATIDIKEEITFEPSSITARHGLEWQVPYIYAVSGAKRKTELKINSVVYYPLSNPEEKSNNIYSRRDENGWAILRIGNPDVYIEGTYVYVIDYTLKYSAISYFEDNDEVYLNIIGPGWNIPIENASANIKLPGEALDTICYTGPDESKLQNCTISKIDDTTYTVKPNTVLQQYEGYTVAIKLSKGVIEDTTKEQLVLTILANIGILLPIPIGIYLFGFLKKKYKNERLTIIPNYKPEKDMDSLLAGTLLTGSYNSKYITAVLIELATKGYFKIREYEDKKYEFIKKDKDGSDLPSHLKSLFDAIFAHGLIVPIKKLTNFYSTANRVYGEGYQYLKDNDFLSTKSITTKSIFIILSIILVFTPILFGYAFINVLAIGWMIGFIISGILLFIFSLGVDIRTEYGNKRYHHLLDLKMYINTAEKHRIEFHNDPKKYNEVFEKLLPYAMIFGLEKKWAKEFEDIYTQTPEWYEGNFTAFNAYYLANTLGTFNSKVAASSVPPSSYGSSGGFRSGGWSSGGSGFGGGGSSGGGGGGSGGGGW